MKRSRRDFLKMAGMVAMHQGAARRAASTAAPRLEIAGGPVLNDIHSQLNATRVARVARPRSVEELRSLILEAKSEGGALSISGGRHAMGGQQFGTGNIHIDLSGMNRVLGFDRERGIIDVEAGIQWPQLLGNLAQAQLGEELQWGIIQKQTGADRLSLGGALAANVHGRGLIFKPFIDNVESFTLLDHTGTELLCNRAENSELFRLAAGGYGLFGIATSIRLRLWARKKVQRIVELRESNGLMEAFQRRIADGYLYGDWQFATDSGRDSFLRRGVFSCYRPVEAGTPLTKNPTRFHPEDWARLTYYTHRYKRRAFEAYTRRYLATSGQVYWADSQLSGAYVDNYHEELDRKLRTKVKATEMITEIYVPRSSFVDFIESARLFLRKEEGNVIYGTVRLIEKDTESFLRWAREPWACVIFNLHVTHDPRGLAHAARAFRGLIDLGIRYGGTFYLTYHRWATRDQIEACYPQFREFLRLKQTYDPHQLFQSDWYRHYRKDFLGTAETIFNHHKDSRTL